MRSPVEILSELNGISYLIAGIEKKNIFSVPEGYFKSLPEKVISRISTSPFPLKNIFTIPEGYFEDLSSSILNKIKPVHAEQELKDLSPLLYDLHDRNVFTVPLNYFENISEEVSRKIHPAAKVIRMRRDPVWKYAVAAVMTGIIGLSSLTMFNKSQRPELVPVNESGIPSYQQAISQYKNEDQINAGMSKLSDEEIRKYLDNGINETDNETLTNNIEENDLPAQKDYLLNEKTLETYLNGNKTDSGH